MNPATAFATTFADELIRCGLREAVVAPGSRNAPLALALWQRSGSNPDHAVSAAGGSPQREALRLHVRIDERSAAFLALGLAKTSGRPALVVCTSGTAAAHFHAAVVEADESAVPLLVVTADRPPEFRGTGANQAPAPSTQHAAAGHRRVARTSPPLPGRIRVMPPSAGAC